MNFQNPYLNPYGMPQPVIQQMAPPVQVTKVNGENGARAYQIGANSSALLLDESGLLVWLVTSDGAGYKTVTPYDIKPHQTVPAPDFGSLEGRIKKLEDIVNEYTADSSAIRRKVNNPAADPADDQHGQVSRQPSIDAEPAYTKQPSNYADRSEVWQR